jgi:chromate transporter
MTPTFREALRFWLKLGFISFGGPAGQIAIMHDELVERRQWIAEDKFLHALNYCMLLPGPEAQQLATYIGWRLHGVRGGLAAGVLFILPSIFILLGLSIAYVTFGQIPWVGALFDGLQPAVVAIVLLALWRIAKKSLSGPAHYAMAAAAFVALYFFAVPFPAVVLGALLVGGLAQRFGRPAPASSSPLGGPVLTQEGVPEGTSVAAASRVGDTRTRPWRRLAATLSLALLLWVAPLALLAATAPDFAFWRQLATFFTQAALVTFGGAYAVLPYVAQVAVESFHWLSREQMVDGLALGESTPGPLIMVLAFVGFMAGVDRFGGSPAWGSLGLLVTVYYTFLPSFVFIFAGAPLIERTQTNPALKRMLGFVTAAVVGVVLNLALYLGRAVIWPSGQGIDWLALTWVLISLAVLWRYRSALIPWLLASAAFGLAAAQLR